MAVPFPLRPGRTALVALISCGVLGSLWSCESKKRARLNPTEGLTGGVLVFEDDFERAEPGESWLNRSGRWRIEAGRLRVQNDRNEGLWLNEPLPARVRVEFDAVAESEEGDIKFEIFAAEQRHQTGYVVIMGGWRNTVSIIARLDEHGDDRLEAGIRADKGRTYHFTVVRTDNSLRWYVDGKLALQYRDEEPLRGNYFAFSDWTAPITFDNFKVYQL